MSEITTNHSFESVAQQLSRRRCAGVLVPVFSLRRDGGLGIGDVTALKELIDWASSIGLGFVQLLPINETGSDNSPYNAISSVALDPLTLDCSPGMLPDLAQSQYDKVTSSVDEDLLHDGVVHYEMVRLLKLELLWRSFQMFFSTQYKKHSERDIEFHAFCEKQQKWLADYCLFRLFMDMEGSNQNWQSWSEDYNTVEKAREHLKLLLAAEPEKTERQLVFYAYIQWLAKLQWGEASEYAASQGLALMGDMPIGVALCSADVFANPEEFDLEWFGGAPPETNFKEDEFTQKWGQNWGIPLYDWQEMQDEGFSWWHQRVEKMCEIFSMFRIDHALGFFRIYGFPWSPVRNAEFLPLTHEEAAQRCDGRLPGFRARDDETEEHRAANREEGKRYLRMIQEAAGNSVVIAEDLGVVPDYVRPALAEMEIPGMKVPQWEFQDQGHDLVRGQDYPEISFATYATHDHLPMRMQWEQHREILLRGQQDTGDYWEAWRFFQGLANYAGIELPENEPMPEYGDVIRERLLAALCESHSRYAGIMITDLLGLSERINTPGVAGEGNWVWRLSYSGKALQSEQKLVKIGDRVKKLLNQSNRVSTVGGAHDEHALQNS